MIYHLMNKDNIVASFIKSENEFEETYELISYEKEKLPIGFSDIESWLDKRQAAKHREHLRRLMKECGCLKQEGFIRITHATSLNDTFWVKAEKEEINWSEVSLYQNEFDEVISKISFEGTGLYGMQFSSTTPEFSTEGTFEKCWKRENNNIYLYKRGSTGARNAGLEVLSEVYASQIADKLCSGHSIRYTAGKLHKKEASKCKLFTDEKNGFTSFSNIMKRRVSIKDSLHYFEQIGSEEQFRRMIVFDGIVFNIDRHMGNYGVIFDNDTLEIKEMAPIFDHNLALLPYAEDEDFEHLGEYLEFKTPKIGSDFLQMAKAVMTSEIRADLINLHGFQFDYIASEKFSERRLKKIEQLVNQQIAGMLDKNKLYTIDVFPKSVMNQLDKLQKDTKEEQSRQKKIEVEMEERS